MIRNDKNRELKLVIAALALTACHILGIDITAAMQLAGGSQVDPDVTALAAIIKEAHTPTGGDWKSIVSMWRGVGVYSFGRVWLKSKAESKEGDE